MADTGLLGLYWGPRRQDVEACAGLWLHALHALSGKGFSTYYQKGRSRKDALRRPIDLTLASIQAILAKGVNRRDDNREPIPELGFHFSAWSGHRDGEAYSVSGTCGCWSERVSNTFVLDLPTSGPYSLPQALTSLKQVFGDLVEIWQPDKAVLCDMSELAWENRRFAPTMRSYERFERNST